MRGSTLHLSFRGLRFAFLLFCVIFLNRARRTIVSSSLPVSTTSDSPSASATGLFRGNPSQFTSSRRSLARDDSTTNSVNTSKLASVIPLSWALSGGREFSSSSSSTSKSFLNSSTTSINSVIINTFFFSPSSSPTTPDILRPDASSPYQVSWLGSGTLGSNIMLLVGAMVNKISSTSSSSSSGFTSLSSSSSSSSSRYAPVPRWTSIPSISTPYYYYEASMSSRLNSKAGVEMNISSSLPLQTEEKQWTVLGVVMRSMDGGDTWTLVAGGGGGGGGTRVQMMLAKYGAAVFTFDTINDAFIPGLGVGAPTNPGSSSSGSSGGTGQGAGASSGSGPRSCSLICMAGGTSLIDDSYDSSTNPPPLHPPPSIPYKTVNDVVCSNDLGVTWFPALPLPFPLFGATGVQVRSSVWLVGGLSGNTTRTIGAIKIPLLRGTIHVPSCTIHKWDVMEDLQDSLPGGPRVGMLATYANARSSLLIGGGWKIASPFTATPPLADESRGAYTDLWSSPYNLLRTDVSTIWTQVSATLPSPTCGLMDTFDACIAATTTSTPTTDQNKSSSTLGDYNNAPSSMISAIGSTGLWEFRMNMNNTGKLGQKWVDFAASKGPGFSYYNNPPLLLRLADLYYASFDSGDSWNDLSMHLFAGISTGSGSSALLSTTNSTTVAPTSIADHISLGLQLHLLEEPSALNNQSILLSLDQPRVRNDTTGEMYMDNTTFQHAILGGSASTLVNLMYTPSSSSTQGMPFFIAINTTTGAILKGYFQHCSSTSTVCSQPEGMWIGCTSAGGLTARCSPCTRCDGLIMNRSIPGSWVYDVKAIRQCSKYQDAQCAWPSPSPSPSPSVSATPSFTPSNTPSTSPSSSPTPSMFSSLSSTTTSTPSQTSTATPSQSPTTSTTPSPSPTSFASYGDDCTENVTRMCTECECVNFTTVRKTGISNGGSNIGGGGTDGTSNTDTTRNNVFNNMPVAGMYSLSENSIVGIVLGALIGLLTLSVLVSTLLMLYATSEARKSIIMTAASSSQRPTVISSSGSFSSSFSSPSASYDKGVSGSKKTGATRSTVSRIIGIPSMFSLTNRPSGIIVSAPPPPPPRSHQKRDHKDEVEEKDSIREKRFTNHACPQQNAAHTATKGIHSSNSNNNNFEPPPPSTSHKSKSSIVCCTCHPESATRGGRKSGGSLLRFFARVSPSHILSVHSALAWVVVHICYALQLTLADVYDGDELALTNGAQTQRSPVGVILSFAGATISVFTSVAIVLPWLLAFFVTKPSTSADDQNAASKQATFMTLSSAVSSSSSDTESVGKEEEGDALSNNTDSAPSSKNASKCSSCSILCSALLSNFQSNVTALLPAATAVAFLYDGFAPRNTTKNVAQAIAMQMIFAYVPLAVAACASASYVDSAGGWSVPGTACALIDSAICVWGATRVVSVMLASRTSPSTSSRNVDYGLNSTELEKGDQKLHSFPSSPVSSPAPLKQQLYQSSSASVLNLRTSSFVMRQLLTNNNEMRNDTQESVLGTGAEGRSSNSRNHFSIPPIPSASSSSFSSHAPLSANNNNNINYNTQPFTPMINPLMVSAMAGELHTSAVNRGIVSSTRYPSSRQSFTPLLINTIPATAVSRQSSLPPFSECRGHETPQPQIRALTQLHIQSQNNILGSEDSSTSYLLPSASSSHASSSSQSLHILPQHHEASSCAVDQQINGLETAAISLPRVFTPVYATNPLLDDSPFADEGNNNNHAMSHNSYDDDSATPVSNMGDEDDDEYEAQDSASSSSSRNEQDFDPSL